MGDKDIKSIFEKLVQMKVDIPTVRRSQIPYDEIIKAVKVSAEKIDELGSPFAFDVSKYIGRRVVASTLRSNSYFMNAIADIEQQYGVKVRISRQKNNSAVIIISKI